MDPSRFQDVSIDLETLGTTSRSAFVTIGACKFNAKTGDVDTDNTFYRRIDWGSATAGRAISADTLHWWTKQQADALREISQSGGAMMRDVLNDFTEWLPNKCRPWGNGATFDVGMVEDAYNQYRIKIPWDFWNIRDMRTVVDMGRWLGMDPKKIKREGTHHNALDDALHQAKVIGLMQKTILKRAGT